MRPRIAMVSTYPPTRCGIATFARSLGEAMADSGSEVSVVGLGEGEAAAAVAHRHVSPEDLLATAQVLNSHDVVVLQHEFGIYDGPDGDSVLDILAATRVPVITVVHTVLPAPSHRQRRVMQGLLNASDAVVTMTSAAYRNVLRHYRARRGTVQVIPHGSPDLRRSLAPRPVERTPRLLTWGLISPGKGIEWGIEAMALLKDLSPAPEYVIAGRTHPKVRARDGEAYREELVSLAESLGVADRVSFIDEYLDAPSLANLVRSASAFLLPYDSTDQVTSGVLVEAMVAGGPVIATRFPHAVELLGTGAGLLVPHRSPQAIADAVRALVADEVRAAKMRRMTAGIGEAFLWPAVGQAYVSLADALWRRSLPRMARVDERELATRLRVAP